MAHISPFQFRQFTVPPSLLPLRSFDGGGRDAAADSASAVSGEAASSTGQWPYQIEPDQLAGDERMDGGENIGFWNSKNRPEKRRLEYYVKWKGHPPWRRPQRRREPGSESLPLRYAQLEPRPTTANRAMAS